MRRRNDRWKNPNPYNKRRNRLSTRAFVHPGRVNFFSLRFRWTVVPRRQLVRAPVVGTAVAFDMSVSTTRAGGSGRRAEPTETKKPGRYRFQLTVPVPPSVCGARWSCAQPCGRRATQRHAINKNTDTRKSNTTPGPRSPVYFLSTPPPGLTAWRASCRRHHSRPPLRNCRQARLLESWTVRKLHSCLAACSFVCVCVVHSVAPASRTPFVAPRSTQPRRGPAWSGKVRFYDDYAQHALRIGAVGIGGGGGAIITNSLIRRGRAGFFWKFNDKVTVPPW